MSLYLLVIMTTLAKMKSLLLCRGTKALQMVPVSSARVDGQSLLKALVEPADQVTLGGVCAGLAGCVCSGRRV